MNILLCNGKAAPARLRSPCSGLRLGRGGKVAVLDRDPGTATKWIQECDSRKYYCMTRAPGYDVFIDTPRLDALARSLASCSVAVIVCSPPATLDHQGRPRRSAPSARQGAAASIVQWRALSYRFGAGAPDLAKRIGVKVSTTISRRQCYRHAALLGGRPSTRRRGKVIQDGFGDGNRVTK